MKDCTKNHQKCKTRSQTPLPTRLVEILGPRKARLRQFDNEQGIYLCLSHCWGPNKFLRTTKSSIRQFGEDIPWSSLTKTFQDAIHLTFRLGFKYIWIDSLCIIQDSIDDWRHEGSKMSSIYSNSFLTIAASRAFEGSQGLHCEQDAPLVPKSKSIQNSTGEDFNIYWRNVKSGINHNISRLPLLQRGWVLQERILSPRMLHLVRRSCSGNVRQR
ncbi:heterokaryon incompatibility protein-domain-containing protein [Clohesyomyces aquaticus]|uniref:Heterokaryon incompatibility protein-domain-containing protein n=1 Tax=Clohesyomyces aquaticus TaxID=1231657 RepID=A0A1Y2A7D0_9PLEO|nr:heterokaryon incompatibility protein-domain-containing protein [Clohesyomyces aquaticus]